MAAAIQVRFLAKTIASLAQSVERQTLNLNVAGSSPAGSLVFESDIKYFSYTIYNTSIINIKNLNKKIEEPSLY